jgi:hypothetical protein
MNLNVEVAATELLNLGLDDFKKDLVDVEKNVSVFITKYLDVLKNKFNIIPDKQTFLSILSNTISKNLSDKDLKVQLVQAVTGKMPWYLKIFVNTFLEIALVSFKGVIVNAFLSYLDKNIISKVLGDSWYEVSVESLNKIG